MIGEGLAPLPLARVPDVLRARLLQLGGGALVLLRVARLMVARRRAVDVAVHEALLSLLVILLDSIDVLLKRAELVVVVAALAAQAVKFAGKILAHEAHVFQHAD